MKLHSPRFEKAVRRGVRKAVRASKALRRARRASRRPGNYRVQRLMRPLLSFALGAAVASVYSQTKQVTACLAVITIWSLGFIAIQAQRFINTLYQSPDIQAFWLLPIDEAVVFRWLMQRFLRGAVWSLVDFICAYGAFALAMGGLAQLWLGVLPLAVVTWLHVLALSLLAVRFAGWFPFTIVTAVFYFGAIAMILAGSLVGKVVLAILCAAGATLNLLLPTGWPVSLSQVFLPHGDLFLLLLLIPIGATLATIKHSLARLRVEYRFAEPVMPDPRDMPLDEETAHVPADNDVPLRVGRTEIEEAISSRAFLRGPAWPERARLERALWKGMSQRQRILVEFAFPNGLDLTRSWKKIFRNLAITAAIAFVLHILVRSEIGYWILAGGLFITVCHVLYLALNNGRAFAKVFCSGVNIPLYAGYGIGFRELSAVLIRLSLFQFPLVAAYCLGAVMLTFALAGWPWWFGLVWAMKLSGVILFGRFALLPFTFSSGTNDSSGIRIKSLMLIFVVILLTLAFIGCVVASLFVPHQGYGAVCFVAAGLIAVVLFRAYGFFYNRNMFDLMNIPPQQ